MENNIKKETIIKIMKINIFLSRVDRSKKNQAELDRLMTGREKLMTMGKEKNFNSASKRNNKYCSGK